MDAVSESRLSQVYPILADKIRQMAVQLQAQNILIRVVQGLRTSAQQDALYAQGRTQPGNVVTNCPGGHSYHNFGLAVDCVPSINGFEMLYAPDWNASHPAWKAMIAAGEGLGLVSGSQWPTFPDYPHFQLTGRFPDGAPDDELRQIASTQGLQAVWNEVTG